MSLFSCLCNMQGNHIISVNHMQHETLLSRFNVFWAIILFYLIPIAGISAYNALGANNYNAWKVLSLGLLLCSLGTIAFYWLMSHWETEWRQSPQQDSVKAAAQTDEVLSSDISEEVSSPNFPSPTETEEYRSLACSLEVAQQSSQKLQGDIDFLTKDLDQLSVEKENLTNELLKISHENEQKDQEIDTLRVEINECRSSTHKQLEEQQAYIRDLQELIAEQKLLTEKKQQQVNLLETKVNDLTNQIKTLLQRAETNTSSFYTDSQSPNSSPSSLPTLSLSHEENDDFISNPEQQIRTTEEASQQLKRCLDIAQKLTGSHRFNNQFNAFIDSPADSFTLDLRRLCDALRSENNSAILLYSPKENQLLFANNQIKSLTGWSPEKFIQSFTEIVSSEDPWRQGIANLSIRSETQVKLSLKSKTGQEITLNGNLGMIPTGIFRQHAICVLY